MVLGYMVAAGLVVVVVVVVDEVRVSMVVDCGGEVRYLLAK